MFTKRFGNNVRLGANYFVAVAFSIRVFSRFLDLNVTISALFYCY